MDATSIVTAGAVSTLVLEVVKFIIRRTLKNPSYDFPQKFYIVAIPVLNIIVVPGLAFLGFQGYSMPTDWQEWGMEIVRVLVGSLVTLVTYTAGLKPLKKVEENKALELDGQPTLEH